MADVKVGVLVVLTSSSQGKLPSCFYHWSEQEGEERGTAHWFFKALRRIPVNLKCKLIRSWTLRQQLVEDAIKPPPGKKLRDGYFCLLCTPRGLVVGRVHGPIEQLLLGLLPFYGTHYVTSQWLLQTRYKLQLCDLGAIP